MKSMAWRSGLNLMPAGMCLECVCLKTVWQILFFDANRHSELTPAQQRNMRIHAIGSGYFILAAITGDGSWKMVLSYLY